MILCEGGAAERAYLSAGAFTALPASRSCAPLQVRPELAPELRALARARASAPQAGGGKTRRALRAGRRRGRKHGAQPSPDAFLRGASEKENFASTLDRQAQVRDSEAARQSSEQAKRIVADARAERAARDSTEKARARQRSQQRAERQQAQDAREAKKVEQARVMKARQAAMMADKAASLDSWEQANQLAKREAYRMLKGEQERKKQRERERRDRTELRRQKQLTVLQVKAETNLNHWEEAHAKLEEENARRAKSAADYYAKEQKKKLARDEFSKRKQEMFEKHRQEAERVKREKFLAAEQRRKEVQQRKEEEEKLRKHIHQRKDDESRKVGTLLLELQGLGVKHLEKRARSEGVSANAVDHVMDGDDPKGGLIDLIVDIATKPRPPAAARKARKAKEAQTSLEARVRAMFSVVDTDGNGALSNKEIQAKMDSDDELKTLVKDAGMNPADLFEELDADGDGSVTMLEFLKLLDVMAQEEREKLASGISGALTDLRTKGDVVVMSNNAMELRMRALLEEQNKKEEAAREQRSAEIKRQITVEAANQKMRQSMRDFEESRAEEIERQQRVVADRNRALKDKQLEYAKTLRKMKNKQLGRNEPFFLSQSLDSAHPKVEDEKVAGARRWPKEGTRYVCIRNAIVREAIELDSDKVGVLKVGEEVIALEERISDQRLVRVRCSKGWVTKESSAGPILQPTHAWVPTGAQLVPKQPDDSTGASRPPRRRHRRARKPQSQVSEAATEDQAGDSEDRPMTEYHVEFETSDMGDAIGDLYLRLQGTLDMSKTVLCSNVVWRHFDRGSRCSFVFMAPWLGQIQSVAVGHNVGQATHDVGSRMLLSNVIVRHPDTGTTWRFPCQQWLDDVSRMCVIPEGGNEAAATQHAPRPLSKPYSGARVAFTPAEEQMLFRVTVSLRVVAPESTSMPLSIDLIGTRDGQEHSKAVQISLQIPDTTHPASIETVANFHSELFGPLSECTVRDPSCACIGLGSKLHVYVDYVLVEVKDTDKAWYFDCHRWLDNHDGITVSSGAAPRGVHRTVHPSRRGITEQARDNSVAVPGTTVLSQDQAVSWRDVPVWDSGEAERKGVTFADEGAGPQQTTVSAAAMGAAADSAAQGQLPSAKEAELLQHEKINRTEQELEKQDMVYVVRVLTGDKAAWKALRQEFRTVPPTVSLTLFGTHGPPMMVAVPVSFLPHEEERFVVRLQQYHGVLQGMRVSIDDTAPGAPALPFQWNLLSVTVTDMRRMRSWHSTCRSVFSCSNSITAALLRPTATGRTSAYTVTLILGHDTAAKAKKQRLQVFISGVGGEGSVALIAVPTQTDDASLSSRAVLRCPAGWLPYLGDKLEVGLSHCDGTPAGTSVPVSQAIVVRDGAAMRFRFEREITAGAVHYGTQMEADPARSVRPAGASLSPLPGGLSCGADTSFPSGAAALELDPTPDREYLLRLHFDATAMYSSIECCLGFWQVEPNSSKFAVAWTPALPVTKDASYFAARESYEHTVTVRNPGAELWGIRITVNGGTRWGRKHPGRGASDKPEKHPSWGVGAVDLLDNTAKEIYSCSCDGATLVRGEDANGAKTVSREMVFANEQVRPTKSPSRATFPNTACWAQPLEPVSRDPSLSPWEEWKIEQAKRADAVAEAEKRRAAQDAAMRFGSKIASKASRASVSIAFVCVCSW